MDFSEFLRCYSLDELSDMDAEIHSMMIEKYLSIFKESKKLIFFDVGSHAGSFIKSIKKIKKEVEIHAFEPHPYLYKYLIEKYPDVIVNEKCVTNNKGTCIINIPSLSVAISSVVDRKIFKELEKDQKIFPLERNCITIDSYCEINGIPHIDFLKLDVEGAEFFVLSGVEKTLKDKKISAGQFEIGISESGYSTEDIIGLLDRFGYKVEMCTPSDYFFHKISY